MYLCLVVFCLGTSSVKTLKSCLLGENIFKRYYVLACLLKESILNKILSFTSNSELLKILAMPISYCILLKYNVFGDNRIYCISGLVSTYYIFLGYSLYYFACHYLFLLSSTFVSGGYCPLVQPPAALPSILMLAFCGRQGYQPIKHV
ncbi:hypothetical protein HJG60_011883 [Phyllostomus discolor]|uniref:Uncharacterized protein n=1 Tax=Phyllostomus discolor TaxID=89673 RepID=A0A833ZE84_9CHIR|nr:hypothetical protein HJG60_011883 [Phyllostomus discolor]